MRLRHRHPFVVDLVEFRGRSVVIGDQIDEKRGLKDHERRSIRLSTLSRNAADRVRSVSPSVSSQRPINPYSVCSPSAVPNSRSITSLKLSSSPFSRLRRSYVTSFRLIVLLDLCIAFQCPYRLGSNGPGSYGICIRLIIGLAPRARIRRSSDRPCVRPPVVTASRLAATARRLRIRTRVRCRNRTTATHTPLSSVRRDGHPPQRSRFGTHSRRMESTRAVRPVLPDATVRSGMSSITQNRAPGAVQNTGGRGLDARSAVTPLMGLIGHSRAPLSTIAVSGS